ncbi:YigZ family protein [Mycoplasma sp. 4423]
MINFVKESYFIKKSEFIGYVFSIKSKRQIPEYLDFVKNQHKKARHTVYAYITSQNGVQSAGYNDDGEPKNTAGKPIYQLLQLMKLENILVVVVRYFGGIKLGAGGLIRAYRQASLLAIDKFKEKKWLN